MEFRINQKEIERCLQRAQGFINLKGANPVLSNIKISASKGGIQAFATDYDVGLCGNYVADVSEEGMVTIHGKRLYDIVRQLPEGEVHFRFSGANMCEVSSGKSNLKLTTIDESEVPDEPTMPDGMIELDLHMIKDMIEKTVYAASQNESRMALNGIYCQMFPQAVKVVATDGHRLAFVNRNIELDIKEQTSVIIPRKAVQELKKLLDEAADDAKLGLARADNRVYLSVGSLLFFSREVEGAYPNYEQVIPHRNSKKATISVDILKSAIRRVSTVAAEKSNLIHFNFKENKLEISSEVSEVGEARDELDIEFDSEPLRVGINSS